MSLALEQGTRVRVIETTRRIPLLLYGLLLVLAAYAPLARARLVGEDWTVLAWAAERAAAAPSASDAAASAAERAPPAAAHRPLAALSLLASAWALEPSDGWADHHAWRLRAESLALLLIAGIGVQRFVRRGLQPWTGGEQAQAAGKAAALFFAVHPLAVASVARIGSRGDLLAIALAAWACAVFLFARQQGRTLRMGLALALAFLCAASSARAWFLPCVLAGLEYSSARRHRPRPLRLRTALTTFLVFAALIPLERMLAAVLPWSGGATWKDWGVELASWKELPALAAASAEKLGVLLLPVNTEGMVAALGYGLAGAFLVLALQPAFVAARSAPRLWGRILLGWLLCVLIYQIPDAAVRVAPGRLASGHVLLVPALLVCVGLGIASTALSGIRRVLVPAVLALPYAVLARANALPWVDAGDHVHDLRTELVAAAREHPGARLLVIDLPSSVGGLDAFAPALDAVLAPVYARRELGARPRPVEVRSIDLEGFFVLMRQEEATRLRADGLVVVLPALLAGDASGSPYVWFRLTPPESGDGRVFWRQEGKSPAGLSLDPLASRFVRVKSTPGTTPQREPLLQWIARSPRVSGGERTGTWIEGEDSPIACFDLSRDLGWLLGERISALWFPDALVSITSAEVLAEPPAIELAPPRASGDGAWTFDLGAWKQPRALAGEGYWILGLLDLDRWRHHETSAWLAAPGELVVPDAARTLERLARDSAGPFAWTLEWRVGGVTLARAGGRTRPGQPSPP